MGDDVEKQPLLAKKAEEEEDAEDPNDSMSYDARKLITFEVLRAASGTIWVKASLWRMMGLLLAISLATALVVFLLVKQPEKLDTNEFSKLNGFLKAIVGLLLGFFLTSSVNRWYACTKGFLELFNAIRALHMQLAALGTPRVRTHMCMRYCVLSAHSLHTSLACQTWPEDRRRKMCSETWEKMVSDKNELDDQPMSHASLSKLYPQEKELLAQVEDASQTLWVWVTSLLTRMAADGEIPAMATPVYGKIMSLAEKAFNGIREVQGAVCVQPPYVYVQMMAMLVNVNNIVTAVSFGMTLGVTLCLAKRSGHRSSEVIAKDLQDVAIQFIMSTTGPFLYQTLLEVAVCIAQPFAGGEDVKNEKNAPGRIPIWKLLVNLGKDLRDADYLSGQLPCWQQPRFKDK
mmetsp:Transcript_84713/g.203092  ORF Transcript_84713/g.203092 Transcript_84713/m.203092 type:complete len:402 (-) Transcript_84713:48-1253(-)